MPHSSTVLFLTYWRGLQISPDKAPARGAFEPARLKTLIPQMMMISCMDPGLRFRLSGGFLVALHGRELKDTSFAQLFKAPFRDPVRAAIASSLRCEQPVLFSLQAPWITKDTETSQTETVKLEICICPMMNQYGKVDRFVGILQTCSPMPRDPRGLLGEYSLVSARLQDSNRESRAAHLNLVAAEGRRLA